jgi:hypothetical protein
MADTPGDYFVYQFLRCVKYNGLNQTAWHKGINDILMYARVHDVATGKEKKPEPVLPAYPTQQEQKALNDYSDKEATALAIIKGSIHEKHDLILGDRKDLGKIWKNLMESIERRKTRSDLDDYKAFSSSRWNLGDSLESYINRIKELRAKLDETDIAINERILITHVLAYLPKEWNLQSILAANYKTMVEVEVALNDIKSGVHVIQESTEKALFSSTGYPKHRTFDKTTFKRPYEKKDQKKGPRCYNCDKFGHLKKDCRRRRKINHSKDKEAANVAVVKRNNELPTPAPEGEYEDIEVGITLIAGTSPLSYDHWILDSGCSKHMTGTRNLLYDYEAFRNHRTVIVGNGQQIKAVGQGKALVQTEIGKLRMANVWYAPELQTNLISTRNLGEKGLDVLIRSNGVAEVLKEGRVLIRFNSNGQLYTLPAVAIGLAVVQSTPRQTNSKSQPRSSPEAVDNWHRRLSHLNLKDVMRVETLASGIRIRGAKKDPSNLTCESCLKGKMTRTYSKLPQQRASAKLELIHSDLSGKLPESLSKSRYFLVFIDDYSRVTWIYLLKTKTSEEILSCFKEFKSLVELQSGCKIKRFRSDNGKGEYDNSLFQHFLKEAGIQYEPAPPYSQSMNGVSERKMRSIHDAIRSMLSESRLPSMFWDEGAQSAVYTQNRSPTSTLDYVKTPFEAWCGSKPDISNLRAFGCRAYMNLHDGQREPGKYAPRALVGLHMGYQTATNKVWRVYSPEDRRVHQTADVRFDESVFPGADSTRISPIEQRPGDMGMTIQKDSGVVTEDVVSGALSNKLVTLDRAESRKRKQPTSDTGMEPVRAGNVDSTTGSGANGSTASEMLSGPDTRRDVDEETEGVDENTEDVTSRPVLSQQPTSQPEEVSARGSDNQARELEGVSEPLATEPNSKRQKHGHFHDLTRLQLEKSRRGEVQTALGRIIKPPTKYALLTAEEDSECEACDHTASSMLAAEKRSYGDPLTVREAMLDDRKSWLTGMRQEWNSLIKNGTFSVVDTYPRHKKVIRSKWVLKKKISADGVRYKARLVIKGFEQVPGEDFDQTFAPVARLSTLRAMLAQAAHEDLEIHQLDFETAFLNPTIREEIYMEPPEGLNLLIGEEEADRHKVMRLKKALYGLKQAPLEWYREIGSYLNQIGFESSNNDPNLYIHPLGSKMILYVDDITIISKSIDTIKKHKADLMKKYRMTDLGEISTFLGIEVERNRQQRTLKIHQRSYLERVLERFQMSNCNGTLLPMQKGQNLQSNPGQQASKDSILWYQQVVGSLMYAMVCTRPDLAYTLSRLSKYVTNPSEEHLRAAKQGLRYVRKTTSAGIQYGGEVSYPLEGYTDADFAGDKDNRKSTSGFVFILNGGAISWKSKQQGLVACSTLEAEYIAASEAAKEAIWMERMLKDLDNQLSAKLLYADNQGAIDLAMNGKYSNKTKHIDLRQHHVRDCVEKGLINLAYCPTDSMVADVLTKPLSAVKHEAFSKRMGIDLKEEKRVRGGAESRG